MKILVTIDGSRFGWKAVDYIREHRGHWANDLAVTLLHVDEGKADRVMGAARRRMAGFEGEYQQLVVKGPAAKTIVRVAKRGRFHMICMGSHGYGALEQLLIGSVASKVLALCKIPVLLIR
jgi:nucleotide-binding universal stress UspA family protein